VLDGFGRPVKDTVIELVQANAAGRYAHNYDQHDAPLDPNFSGVGPRDDRCGRQLPLHHSQTRRVPLGQWTQHLAARAYPFSLFGSAFATRLVTQMYFPGDPLFPLDAIACSVPEHARHRIICRFDPETTMPYWALSYRFDFVLRGRDATPMDH